MITPRHTLPRAITSLVMIVVMICGCFTPSAQAQEDPRALDPADVFFQAWLEVKRAEKLETEGKFSEAWEKYRQAANYYEVLGRFHKNWKPHLVQSRVISTRESIRTIEPKATAELAGKKMKTQDLVEGPALPPPPEKKSNPLAKQTPASGYQRAPSSPVEPNIIRSQPIPAQDPRLVSKIQQLERENRTLNQELKNTRLAVQSASKTAESARSTIQSNTEEQKRLIGLIAEKDRELKMMRDVLARAPLQQDLDRLSRENHTRERELEITARALKTSQNKIKEAEAIAAHHLAESNLAKKRIEEIQKNMNVQGEVNNHVIRELRKELKSVTSLLEDSRRDLGQANSRINQMQRNLAESQASIEELTKQRDNLRIERDTLANTLKKSDSKGVQNLITENMRLGRELKEALDRLSFLEANHNATKDELVKARSDLTIAKTRIIRYQQEQADHGHAVQSLESQLRDAQTSLSNAKASSDQESNQEEIEILRATVKRLLAAQERRRMGEQILWETYQKSQVKIEGLTKAIQDIRKIKIDLTDEEEKFVTTHRRPDGEFSNPGRVPLAHARAHGDALQEEISYVEGLVIRHVEKGRLQPAHSILIDINERVPGNYRILCKLGVIEMKLSNFQNAIRCLDEAITMREHSGYAHYMLGVAQYKNNDLDNARNAFERSLKLKPDNANAHLYLGNLAGAAKRYQQAEDHFLSTVKLNPTLPDAYYNLSVLYLQQKRMKDALDYYRMALHHGAQPNDAHEKRLRS